MSKLTERLRRRCNYIAPISSGEGPNRDDDAHALLGDVAVLLFDAAKALEDAEDRLDKIHFETRFVSPRIDEIRRLATRASDESGQE